MRLSKGLLIGLVAVGLVGCEGPAAGPPTTSSSPSVAATGPPASRPSPGMARTEPAAAPPRSASPRMQATARAAATQFYGLYFARQFAASWNLLAPTAKGQIPLSTWVEVHNGCPSAGAGKSRPIKSVTVFGHAAIVTETITGAAVVFNYDKGYWGYSPGDASIYRHGSVTADIAAAKAAGLCSGGKASLL